MYYIINNFGNCVVNYNNTIWHNKWLYKSIQVQSNSFSKKKKKVQSNYNIHNICVCIIIIKKSLMRKKRVYF